LIETRPEADQDNQSNPQKLGQEQVNACRMSGMDQPG
jgi:hypothetical protein